MRDELDWSGKNMFIVSVLQAARDFQRSLTGRYLVVVGSSVLIYPPNVRDRFQVHEAAVKDFPS